MIVQEKKMDSAATVCCDELNVSFTVKLSNSTRSSSQSCQMFPKPEVKCLIRGSPQQRVAQVTTHAVPASLQSQCDSLLLNQSASGPVYKIRNV